MHYDSRKKLRVRPAAAAAMAVALAGVLVGCESPLSQRGAAGEDQYTRSLLTRAMLEGAYGRRFGTTDGGVQELPRIDSPGPAGVPAAAVPALMGPPMPGALIAAATPPTILTPSSQMGTGALVVEGLPDNERVPTLEAAGRVGISAARLGQQEPVKDLTLQDAIARTMKHALSIKVEAHNPAIKESQIVEAEAAFDPVFFGLSQWNLTDEPSTTGVVFTNGISWQNQFGIRRTLPSGAQVQAVLNLNYRDTNTFNFKVGNLSQLGSNNTYTANIGIQVTQPLLRGYGSDVNEANIYLAQRDYRISLSEFKGKVITAAGDVEEAYQNVVLARTNVDVLSHLVVASQQTFDTVQIRIAIDATKASTAQAAQALASRTADLLVAQKTYRAASDRLKALMNDPEFDVASNVLINPVDKPISDPFTYNLDECLDTALRQRPEIQQARLQVERSDIVVKVARNGLLPKLDLTLTTQSSGLDGSPIGAVADTVAPAKYLDFGAGIKFEIPLGNREAESVLRRRVEERKQALDNLVQIAQSVMLDVKTQLREVMSTYDELRYRDMVRRHAADEFQGIIELENIQKLTPEFLQLKLDTQARLALAEQNLIQTVVNYNLGIMRLERAKGTLLEFDRISLDRPPAEHDEGINTLRFLGTTYQKDTKNNKK